MWIEHFDKQSGKPFFYHSVSRETAWEAPAGAKVQYMNEGERGGSSGSGGTAKASSSSPWLVTLALLLPIVLPMLGLLVCYCEPGPPILTCLPRHATSPTSIARVYCSRAHSRSPCATPCAAMRAPRHGEQGGPGGRAEGPQAEARQVSEAPQHEGRQQLSTAPEAITGWQGWSFG